MTLHHRFNDIDWNDMFIACEGVDGAGKSTLIEEITRQIEYRFPGEDIETIHYSQLKKDPLDEYALRFEDYRPRSGKHIICDRWAWGETIYGPLYRGSSALGVGQLRWTEMFMKARGATTWHVSAGLETIQNRLRLRGEEYLQPDHVEHVWEGFSRLAENCLTTGGTAMTDEAPPNRLAEIIVDEAFYSETSSLEVFSPEYIGRALPTVLLVGDIQGNSDPGATAAPFMPRGTSSGTFLLESLPERWWHQVGIVNAQETDLNDLLDKLLYPAVTALGSNASKALDELGIEHSTVPHPQKVRRFHNKRQDEYGRLIRQTTEKKGDYLSWPN
jgi:hypothetical protein